MHPQKARKVPRFILFTAFAIYCYIYPSSLFLLLTDGVPAGMEWMASLMLVLEGLVATGWVVINYGLRRGLFGAVTMLVGAFLVEALGVATGFPFGQYEYTNALSPKLLAVPIGIMFAWLMIILASFFTVRFLMERLWPQRGQWTLIVMSASLALLSDLLMEPVAVHIQRYWTWFDGGTYYGVPTSNFIAWAVISLALVTVLAYIMGEGHSRISQPKAALRYNFIPVALYLMNLVMFTGINLTHGNFAAGILGIMVGLGGGFLLLRACRVGQFLRARKYFYGKGLTFPGED